MEGEKELERVVSALEEEKRVVERLVEHNCSLET